MDARDAFEDQALARLRAEFRGHRIWRSVHSDGRLDGWVGSLHDPAAGVEPLVVCSTEREFREVLLAERERAAEKWFEKVKMDPVMAASSEPASPSPAGAASVEDGSAALVGEAEDARPVPVPPGAPAALPWLIRWRMCVHLDRLARELIRAGWSTAARYEEAPPVLAVCSDAAPHVGESVVVAPGPGTALWFRSSLGPMLAPIADPGGAAWEIAVRLTPRVTAAFTAPAGRETSA
jgi:hypothetical protein